MLCATGCNGEVWVFKVKKWARVGRSGWRVARIVARSGSE